MSEWGLKGGFLCLSSSIELLSDIAMGYVFGIIKMQNMLLII